MTAPFELPSPSAAELEALWLDWLTYWADAKRAPDDAAGRMLAEESFTAFTRALFAADRTVQQELLALVGPPA